MSVLNVVKLKKSYSQPEGRITVLDEVSFTLAAGESVALRGESGSGKSTLLHLIAGLDNTDSGTILFDEQPVHQLSMAQRAALRRDKISLVFQQFHLISTLKVLDNLRFQANLCQRLDLDFEQTLIDKLGLQDQLHKYPHQLSGGQQQRVAIARALLHRPALVLADEPTGNLDEHSSLQVMALFRDLVRQAGSALLMVTHSREMAAYLDQQWWLQQGKLSVLGNVDAVDVKQ
ncbi:MAG: ABC transporter ATP-binding protein [Leucothrix sp.]